MQQESITKLPAPVQTIWQAFLQWWDDLVRQAAISLIWSLSWLTILLGPPVTFGMHYVQSQYIRGVNPGLRGLAEGARKYFVKSWLWMLANLFIGFWLYVSANAYLQIGGLGGELARDFIVLVGLLWFTVQFYTPPILMIQEKESLREAWRNSLFMTLASPVYLLVIFLFLALAGLFSMILIFPIILGYAALFSLTANQAVRDRLEVFRAIAAKNQADKAQRDQDSQTPPTNP